MVTIDTNRLSGMVEQCLRYIGRRSIRRREHYSSVVCFVCCVAMIKYCSLFTFCVKQNVENYRSKNVVFAVFE